MIRKTTPTHIWELSVPVETIDKIEAYYSINGKLVFKKTKDDFVFEGKTAKVKLTQEESLLFANDSLVEIQLFAKTVNGEIIGTDVEKIFCQKCLCDEVIE